MTAGGPETEESAVGMDRKRDCCAGRRPVWPAMLCLFLQVTSVALSMPYMSQIAMDSPYSLDVPHDCLWAPENRVESPECVPQDRGEAMVRAQTIVSATASTSALFELFSAGIVGVLCDKIGTKPVAIVSNIGQLIRMAVLMLSANSHSLIPFQFHHVFTAMLAANAISGLCNQPKIAVAAYLARISTPETRTQLFGRMSACVGFGICAGPIIIMGLTRLPGHNGSGRDALALGCCLQLASLSVVCAAWPSRAAMAEEQKEVVPWSDAFPCKLMKTTLLSSSALAMYGTMFFVDGFAVDMAMAGFAVFLRTVFHWTTAKLSAIMLVHGMMIPIVLGLLLPWVLRRFGEICVLKISALAVLADFLAAFVVGLTAVGDLFFIVPVIGSVGTMMNPVLMGMACRELPKEDMGRLSGAISLVETVAKVASPLLAGTIMHGTLNGPMPSTVYLVAACIMLPGVAMAWLVKPKDCSAGGAASSGEEESSTDDASSSDTEGIE